MPTEGPTTTIVARGPSLKPTEDRGGTPGRFDTSREDRTLLVLVEGLPADTEEVQVTTSGPEGRRASMAGFGVRGGFGLVFSQAALFAERLNSIQRLDTHLELIEHAVRLHEQKDLELEQEEDRLEHALRRAERRVSRAETDKERAKRLQKVFELTRRLEDAQDDRSSNLDGLKMLNHWMAIVQRHRESLIPDCSDGADNDNDGSVDHPADPGCTGPADVDEKHETRSLQCAVDGGTRTHTVDLFTPDTNAIVGARLTSAAGEAIAAPQGVGPEGPTTAPVEVCPGATAQISYGAGPNAPTGSSPFSPPPGDTGARFVITFDNPAGGAPGGGSADVTMSLDTRAP